MCECVEDNIYHVRDNLSTMYEITIYHVLDNTLQPSQQHKTYKTHTFTRISVISAFYYFPMLSYVILCFPMLDMGCSLKEPIETSLLGRDVSSEKHEVNTYGFDNSLKEPMVL